MYKIFTYVFFLLVFCDRLIFGMRCVIILKETCACFVYRYTKTQLTESKSVVVLEALV